MNLVSLQKQNYLQLYEQTTFGARNLYSQLSMCILLILLENFATLFERCVFF